VKRIFAQAFAWPAVLLKDRLKIIVSTGRLPNNVATSRFSAIRSIRGASCSNAFPKSRMAIADVPMIASERTSAVR
jgi:hypothetical protein